ncbi:Stress-response A/B barrel domain-containing protein UP3 [Camellia lanceoleosa]|uniref:Stress-response A/B barrel domain-containing protein UP3 n=1 Tax=Camellia lanceoleosa TaxID=1840588 RepID=A0ACC0GLV7_9ERIC|nr:Stress-response A/B barrel domain-containing protein UP3 [Camellia lanceoleosa]
MSTQIIEHIVLFKVKPNTDPSKIDSMLTGLNAIISLHQVLYLIADTLLRTQSSPFPFTHMLHTRYNSKDNQTAYSDHPSYVTVVTDFVKLICDDIMAIDWVPDSSIPRLPSGWP